MEFRPVSGKLHLQLEAKKNIIVVLVCAEENIVLLIACMFSFNSCDSGICV